MDAFPSDPFEALVALLEGARLSSLEPFVAANEEEGQHLEYKDGRLLEDPVEAKKEIRKQVNGFGNSEGGLLVIGVTETRPREVVPCRGAPGGRRLGEWISSLLSPMAKDFSPPPRFKIVTHSQGKVLVLAVPRAPHLFPIVENREAHYYARFGEHTIPLPPSHVADLLLGRRQAPRIGLEIRLERAPMAVGETVPVTVTAVAHNEGLVAAEEVEGGFLCWAMSPAQPLNSALLQSIDIEEPQGLGQIRDRMSVWHQSCVALSPSGSPSTNERLAPFTVIKFYDMRLHLPFSVPPIGALCYTACFYILCRGATPIWFECSFSFPGSLATIRAATGPVYGRRPLVRISSLGQPSRRSKTEGG